MLIQTVLGVRYETSPEQLRYVLARLREMLLGHPRVDAAGRIAAWEYDGSKGTRSYNSGAGAWSDTSVAYDTNLNVSTVTYHRDGSNIVYEYRYHPVLQRVLAIYGPDSTNVVDGREPSIPWTITGIRRWSSKPTGSTWNGPRLSRDTMTSIT